MPEFQRTIKHGPEHDPRVERTQPALLGKSHVGRLLRAALTRAGVPSLALDEIQPHWDRATAHHEASSSEWGIPLDLLDAWQKKSFPEAVPLKEVKRISELFAQVLAIDGSGALKEDHVFDDAIKLFYHEYARIFFARHPLPAKSALTELLREDHCPYTVDEWLAIMSEEAFRITVVEIDAQFKEMLIARLLTRRRTQGLQAQAFVTRSVELFFEGIKAVHPGFSVRETAKERTQGVEEMRSMYRSHCVHQALRQLQSLPEFRETLESAFDRPIQEWSSTDPSHDQAAFIDESDHDQVSMFWSQVCLELHSLRQGLQRVDAEAMSREDFSEHHHRLVASIEFFREAWHRLTPTEQKQRQRTLLRHANV